MKIFNVITIAFLLFIPDITIGILFGQESEARFDSVNIRRGYMLVLGDSILRYASDTTILVRHGQPYKVKKDRDYRSEEFYEGFEDKSGENIFLKGLYETMIREQKDSVASGAVQKTENYHPEFIDKIAGKIDIIAVDIIDGDVNDPSIRSSKGYAVTLNKLHNDTRGSIIRKNLTIREGEVLGAYTLSDNEYHLRSLPYIEDARIFTVPDSLNPEIINLIVVVKDVFPFTLGFGMGGITDYTLGINDINIAGTGHEFANSFRFNGSRHPSFGYRGELSFNNLWGSFIDAHLLYRNDAVEKLSKLTVEREFITPETKLGGGIEFFHQKTTASVKLSDTSTFKIPYTKDYFDQWIGRAFLLDKVSRKSIILKGRFMTSLYTSRPEVETDTNQQFYNTYLLIGSVTLLRKNHYKERMLLGYGMVEDIDFGYAVELTSGYLFSEFFKSPYLGISLRTGNKYNIGALGGGIEYGGQIYQHNLLLGLFRTMFTYYSPLLKARAFDYRFLFRINYTEGIRRYPHEIINLGKEVRGVSNSGIEGNRRFIARFETVTFLKGNLLGFRFSPNLFYDAAFIGKDQKLFTADNYFSVGGLGVRIRNENLAFQTIIIRLGYYTGNPVKDAHFGIGFTTSTPDVIRDYDIVKPDVLRY